MTTPNPNPDPPPGTRPGTPPGAPLGTPPGGQPGDELEHGAVGGPGAAQPGGPQSGGGQPGGASRGDAEGNAEGDAGGGAWPRAVAPRRGAARVFRPRRVVPAVVVSALVGAAALVVAVSVISTLAGHPVYALRPGLITGPLTRFAWDDLASEAVAAAVIVCGLICLLLAFVPGRYRVVPLAGVDRSVALGLTRAGLRNALASAAATVDGVDRARVKARPRRVRVKVTTPLRAPGDLRAQVRDAVAHRLDDLDPARPVRIKIRVRRRNTGP